MFVLILLWVPILKGYAGSKYNDNYKYKDAFMLLLKPSSKIRMLLERNLSKKSTFSAQILVFHKYLSC